MSLEIQAVEKEFPTRDGPLAALGRIDLTIDDGEFVCLVGPSGCGKTTLLYILAGLEPPTHGQVLADGQPVSAPDPDRVLIFQDGALFPWLTAQGNVEFGLRMKGLSRERREQRAQGLLRTVHLQGFERAWIHQLSGGMRQRVALARALAVDPAVLLLDEPFGALDAMTRERLHQELQEVWLTTHKTMIFVTHNVREAVVLGNRVLVFSPRPGRIVSEHRIHLPRPRHVEDLETAEEAARIALSLRLAGEVTDDHAQR
ncbi:MAG TPA: ABC transporter ATP-binding protein [Anaerolineales bacterium]|nr:ABC transporter ATP-binding protein [Anaerolineales bacterium]